MNPSFSAQITFFFTEDLELSHRFYSTGFGFTMVLDQGSCRIYRSCQGAYVGFCTREGAPSPQGVIFTMVTEEVDKWVERLVEFGAELETEPRYSDTYRIYHSFLRDPNGYRLEIQRFEDPFPGDGEQPASAVQIGEQ